MTITATEPATVIASDYLDLDQRARLDRMVNLITGYRVRNDRKRLFYEGRYVIRDLDISVPESLKRIGTVVGWPGTVVDVLDERLDFLGWTEAGQDLDLSTIFAENTLDSDSGLGHLDALLYGTAFITVGPGGDGEPPVLITVESPMDMTGLYDRRSRRLVEALMIDEIDGQILGATHYERDQTTYLSKIGGRWHRDLVVEHGLGRVPVAQLINRPRGSRRGGRSEITRPVRHYTQAAGRTLLGMEVHREFYQAPQRYVIGAAQDAFTRSDGSNVGGWETIMGRVLGLERDENGDLPTVGQFPQSTPGPYLDQVRGLAQLLAAECGIPAAYLGFTTENPASADAIRAGEARLVKRAERRQTAFGHAWQEVAKLALLIRDGGIPDRFHKIVSVDWRDAATPTRAAAADEATKLVGSGILTPDSRVTYNRVGLSPQEQRQIEIDKAARPSDAALIAQALSAQAQPNVDQLAS